MKMSNRDTTRADIDADADETDEPLDDIKRRAFEGVERCIRLMFAAINRDFETCGKASCARSRRCRNSACEPAEDEN